jgi:hypothetical protein
MVKRVFITSDLGEEGMPKWASIVKVIVDGKTLASCNLLSPSSSSFFHQSRGSSSKRVSRDTAEQQIHETDQERHPPPSHPAHEPP